MARIQHALIMAAGRGQRMMPLTMVIPKSMAPYQDSTLIADGIAKVRRVISHVHVTVGYKGTILVPHLIEQGVSSIFNTEGRPNSWWIYNTLMRHLDEPIFLLTCDNVTDLDFERLERDYVLSGSPACMLVPVAPVEGLEGDYIFHEDRVVTRLSRSERADMYCSGIQIINPSKVARSTRDEGDFYSVWNQLMEQEQLMVSSVSPSRWFSVDSLADLTRLEGLNRLAGVCS